MNTTKLKRFATEARNKLRQGVEKRLAMLGFNDAGVHTVSPQLVSGGAVWKDKPCTVAFYNGFRSLEEQIRRYGVSHVVEEAAYTWFNRLMAIRILTMNNLCEPVLRYVGSTRTPLIVDEARQGHIPEMDEEDRAALMKLIDDDTKTPEQFAMLISVFCHDTPLIAKCFSLKVGAPSRLNNDYTDVLFPSNILSENGFIDMLNTTDFITEEDYHSSELLGWLYQFYISEKKDQVFAKKGKYDADDIPAATQIFTPNWIVKYMVQNTIVPQLTGRSGALAALTDDELKEKYKYLVLEEDCETARGRASSQLEYLKVADLACGSGHILNECFDLLYDLYISEGYTRREAIECIFTNNLTGIDIDTRAKQLATFALMLKACKRDASLVDASLMPHILCWEEARPRTVRSITEDLTRLSPSYISAELVAELEENFKMLENARELGSIIKFNIADETRVLLEEYVESCDSVRGRASSQLILAMTENYDAIVMNPPYMPTSKLEGVREYVEINYPDSKTDLFSVFMDVCLNRLKNGGRYGMINMQSWMFLSSFEPLRKKIVEEQHIVSLLHLGPHTFDELSGEVVQNVAFIVSKEIDYKYGVYFRLISGKDCNSKMELFFNKEFKYVVPNQNIFSSIPSYILGYWMSEKVISLYKNESIENIADLRSGISTGDNNRFYRLWFECNPEKISFDSSNQPYNSSYKWFKIIRGGTGRKWYGNCDNVINIANDCYEIRNSGLNHRLRTASYYNKKGITWSRIASENLAFRIKTEDVNFGENSPCLFPNENISLVYLLGLLNSKLIKYILGSINPTLSFQLADIVKTPVLLSEEKEIEEYVQDCISISKTDWDAHETSWDFEMNPLLAVDVQTYMDNIDAKIEMYRMETGETLCIDTEAPQLDSLKWRYEQYCQKWESLFMKLHANEEELNRRFIEIYGLQDELNPEVPLNEITILQQGEIGWEEARPRAVNSSEGTVNSDGFLRKDEKIEKHGDHPPHWNQTDTFVFLTFRLGDSLPKEKQEEINSKREIWMQTHPQPWDEETEREYHKTFSHKVEEWLDNGYGCCILKNVEAASIIEATLNHDDGKKYNLIDYVIMPNHVHTLVRLISETKIEDLMQEWKSVSSHRIKKVLGSQWCGWMEKYHDRIIRNEDHYNNVIGYIYKNYSHGGVRIGGAVYSGSTDVTARGRASSQLIWHPDVIIKQFISYAVGCMMGRYRLDRPGLAIAHPNEIPEEIAEYEIPGTNEKFWIDNDGIIPLMHEDCGFHVNAVNRMATFVRQTLGDQTQVENLNFIEECLGKSLEQYLIKDFWKDHKKMYQNRPIYWLFASKKGAFQVLVYVHRMNVATVERIRSRYLLPYIERLNKRINDLQSNESTLSTKQRNQLKTLRSQVAECEEYHNRLAVVAERGIVPNLDDGIIKNHALYGDIVTKLK